MKHGQSGRINYELVCDSERCKLLFNGLETVPVVHGQKQTFRRSFSLNVNYQLLTEELTQSIIDCGHRILDLQDRPSV